MRTRKRELEALIAVLEREHDDVDALASEIWKLIDDYRRDRDLWVVAVRHIGMNFLYGPYESEASAKKDVERGSIKSIGNDDKYMIMHLLSPSKIFEDSAPATLFDMR